MEEIKLCKVKVKWGVFPNDFYRNDLYLRTKGSVKVFALGDNRQLVDLCDEKPYNAYVDGMYRKHYIEIPQYILDQVFGSKN